MDEIDLYIDDSGTKEFEDREGKLFCYAGLLIRKEIVKQVDDRINSLKLQFFNAIPEIKSHWLRRPKKREEKYIQPFNTSDKAINKFYDSYIQLLIQQRGLKVVGVVIDKEKLLNTYSKSHFYPSSVAYEFLMQRIQNFCSQNKIKKTTIFFDDMSGKTPKGSEWKKLLIEQHKKLKNGTSPFYRKWANRPGMDYRSIGSDITFCNSANNNFIQIADICAYNIMRQARDCWNSFDKGPFYKGFKTIIPLIHKKKNTICSFGCVCFPTKEHGQVRR